MNRHILILLIMVCLGAVTDAYARHITGRVVAEEDSTPIAGAYITVFGADSVSTTLQSGRDGFFSFTAADSVVTTLAFTALGYCDGEITLRTDTVSSPLVVRLREAALSGELEEVTVTADRSRTIGRTANGQVFHLSERARGERNPYLALVEIPLLISDASTSSVRMLDGRPPLVLIDGNRVNSGISPILPEDIESVEVITSVPARYLQEGYGGIVNIRLRRNRKPYVWLGVSMSQSLPSSTSGPGLNFEVGNERFSVYGAGLYVYDRNAGTRSTVRRGNVGYTQGFSSSSTASSDRWMGWLFMKWRPTLRDYLAASVRYTDSDSETHSSAEGEYTSDGIALPYLSEGGSRDRGDVLSASLYYRHSFADGNDLEVTATANTNVNRLDSRSTETFGEDVAGYASAFHNERLSALLEADYSRTFGNGYSVALGNHLTMGSDKIDQRLPENPLFRHRRLDDYLYSSFGGMWRRLYYTLSAGVEAIWLVAGDVRSHYVRPRSNVSATWVPNSANSLQLSCTLTNEAPSVALLNPLNTSTDPLVVMSGNPHLKPGEECRVDLNYTLTKRGWYVSPQLIFLADRNLISPWGYSDGEVYHSTFRNCGRYSEMNYFLTVAYNAPWCSVTTSNGWTSQNFRGLPARGYFQSYASLMFRMGKFLAIVEADYRTRTYTENSTTRHRSPLQSRLHVSYNFTPDFYVAVGLHNYTSTVRSVTDVRQGTFHSVTETFDRGAGRGFRPYVTIYYNFRQNMKRRIKFNNPDFKEDTGISLKP